jgi:coenzyme PQQ precursor peptide PqqA
MDIKWITPDFEQIPVSMECTAYSGDVDQFDA